MDDDVIATAYVIIDDVMRSLNRHRHPLAQLRDAEILLVAIAALHLQHHHERTRR